MKTPMEKTELILKKESLNIISLSDWELEFLDSIETKLNQGKELSWKQIKCLNKIYEKE